VQNGLVLGIAPLVEVVVGLYDLRHSVRPCPDGLEDAPNFVVKMDWAGEGVDLFLAFDHGYPVAAPAQLQGKQSADSPYPTMTTS
jgi:hypothetical protein